MTMEMLWGYLLPQLAEQANGPAANRDITLADLAGYINPDTLGFSTDNAQPTLAREQSDRNWLLDIGQLLGSYGGEPTLAREQMENQFGLDVAQLMGSLGGDPTLAREMWQGEREDAERNYALDVARFGLQQAQLNYAQRVAEADTRLKELGLLASQRGPENAISYNYLLGNMDAPAGEPVSTSGASGSINQPFNMEMPDFSSFARTPAPEPPAAPQSPSPSPKPRSRSRDRDSGSSSGSSRSWQEQALDRIQPKPTSGGLNQVNKQIERYDKKGLTSSQRSELETWRRNNPDAESSLRGIGFAEGGIQPDPEGMAVVGEQGPELAIGMPEGGFGVLNQQQLGMNPEQLAGEGEQEMSFTKDQVLDAIGQFMSTLMGEGAGGGQMPQSDGQMPQQGLPGAQEGGFFGGASNIKFSPEEIAGMPAIQQIMPDNEGQQPAFGGNKLNMQVPDTETTLPMGHQVNMRTLERMQPSSLKTLASVVETGRNMGGLGLDFGDWLHSARAAAPVGRSWGGAAGYGR